MSCTKSTEDAGEFLERADDENKLFPLSIMTENARSPVYEAASSEL